MATKNTERRLLPHEERVGDRQIPLKYQDNDEPMSGTASNAAKAPEAQKVGYQNDVILDWDNIAKKLAAQGFRLNTDLSLGYISLPDFPKGIDREAVPMQLVLRDKAYAKTVGRRNMIGILASDALTEYQQKIAKCLYDPTASKFDLKAIGAHVKEWTIPEPELSDRNWRGEGGVSTYGHHIPSKVLPKRSQFPAEVQKLSFGDIFTIFKGASLEQLKLFIGRTIVGPRGSVDPFTKETLDHTYRNILVVDGAHAGQGKSYLFGWLAGALKRVGYNVFNATTPLNSRFNHHDAFSSDYIYRDDATTESLAEELGSANAKILATGGYVATEQKGVDAVQTKCSATLLYCVNRVEQRLFWGLDDGMRSRITVCATEPEGSTPVELLPKLFIPALADRLGVELDTIMLWACRLAADEFANYINGNSAKLETRVKELADQSISSSADPLDGALSALVLGYILETKEAPPKNISKNVLAIALKGMVAVKQAPDIAKLLGDPSTIPAWSPAVGMKWINPESVVTAYHTLQSGGIQVTPNKLISDTFKALGMKDGNQCYGSPSVILPRWTSLVANAFTLGRIKDLADMMSEKYATVRGRMNVDIDQSLDFFYCS